MERAEKLSQLGNKAVELIQEFRREACTLGENPTKSVEFINDENTIVIEDSSGERYYYSLSEVSYIFKDGIDGFNHCGTNFPAGIDFIKSEAKYEYDRMSKDEFSNYIGSLMYSQYRCEDIFNKIAEIQNETELL